jgi:hypothetical protein
MLRLAVAPMVLPGAGRLWKATFERVPAINPSWVDAPYAEMFLFDPHTFTISPWSRTLTRSVFPEGMGETIRPLTFERSAPALVEPTWSPINA